jgi:hypothetical protein
MARSLKKKKKVAFTVNGHGHLRVCLGSDDVEKGSNNESDNSTTPQPPASLSIWEGGGRGGLLRPRGRIKAELPPQKKNQPVRTLKKFVRTMCADFFYLRLLQRGYQHRFTTIYLLGILFTANQTISLYLPELVNQPHLESGSQDQYLPNRADYSAFLFSVKLP